MYLLRSYLRLLNSIRPFKHFTVPVAPMFFVLTRTPTMCPLRPIQAAGSQNVGVYLSATTLICARYDRYKCSHILLTPCVQHNRRVHKDLTCMARFCQDPGPYSNALELSHHVESCQSANNNTLPHFKGRVDAEQRRPSEASTSLTYLSFQETNEVCMLPAHP